MSCHICGRTIAHGQLFCPGCGTRISLIPPPIGALGYTPQHRLPVRSRVERNLQPLGVLWCIFGGIRLLQGLIGLVFVKMLTAQHHPVPFWPFGIGAYPSLPPWMHALLPFIVVGTVAATTLAFLTGYALLTRRSWGRPLALVVAVLSLIRLPLGTAIGIYTLVILAPAASALEYEILADHNL